MSWRTNKGMQVLVNQIKAKNPGCVIGTIGDNRHAVENPSSDHNPKLLNGSEVVNACDPMVGPQLTSAEIDIIVKSIVASRDPRVKYIIWQRRIISGPGGIQPWVWRKYTGTSDPHTGHAHFSVTDGADKNTAQWRIETVAQKPYPSWVDLDAYALPILKQGMSDADYAGYNNVARLQDLVGAETDGEYGPATAAKVAERVGSGDGKTVDLDDWVIILGLAKR